MVLGYGNSISYDALVQRITGDMLDKSHRFTDWTRRPLSDSQLSYAAVRRDAPARRLSRAHRRPGAPRARRMGARERQIAYNAEHGIDPQTIRKSVTDILERLRGSGDGTGRAKRSRADVRSGKAGHVVRTSGLRSGGAGWAPDGGPPSEVAELIEQLEEEMRAAAAELRFEEAALLPRRAGRAPAVLRAGPREPRGRSGGGWVIR